MKNVFGGGRAKRLLLQRATDKNERAPRHGMGSERNSRKRGNKTSRKTAAKARVAMLQLPAFSGWNVYTTYYAGCTQTRTGRTLPRS